VKNFDCVIPKPVTRKNLHHALCKVMEKRRH
jgi:hypothetical protein